MMGAEHSAGLEERLLRQFGVLPPTISAATDAAHDCAAGLTSSLVIPAEQLQLTNQELGFGGTGRVVLGYLGSREVGGSKEQTEA